MTKEAGQFVPIRLPELSVTTSDNGQQESQPLANQEVTLWQNPESRLETEPRITRRKQQRRIIRNPITEEELTTGIYLPTEQIETIYGIKSDRLRRLRQSAQVTPASLKRTVYYSLEQVNAILKTQVQEEKARTKTPKAKRGHRPQTYKHMNQQELSALIKKHHLALPDRQLTILRLRGGLEDGKFWTLEEVRQRVDLGSKAAVAKAEKRTLNRLRKLQEGGTKNQREIDNDLVMQYHRLVFRIANNLKEETASVNLDLEDMTQEGLIGLIDALNRFDPTKGAEFTTYASMRIRGSIIDAIRKNRARTTPRLNNLTEAEMETIDKERHKAYIDPDPLSSPEESSTLKEETSAVHLAISRLPERNRRIIHMYFFLNLQQREIGQILELSESRISQLLHQSVAELKKYLEKTYFSPLNT